MRFVAYRYPHAYSYYLLYVYCTLYMIIPVYRIGTRTSTYIRNYVHMQKEETKRNEKQNKTKTKGEEVRGKQKRVK